MNVIFTDYDGVFHPTGQAVPLHWKDIKIGENFFLPKLVRPFVRFCHQFDIKLVVSSTWRFDFSIRQLNEVFDGLIIGTTPHISRIPAGQPMRWLEVQGFLSDYPEIKAFAIIDDQADLFPQELENLVVTDGHVGLVPADLVRLKRRLVSSKNRAS